MITRLEVVAKKIRSDLERLRFLVEMTFCCNYCWFFQLPKYVTMIFLLFWFKSWLRAGSVLVKFWLGPFFFYIKLNKKILKDLHLYLVKIESDLERQKFLVGTKFFFGDRC